MNKIVAKGKKRVGRGYGSGKGGHTTGRGAKGQKIRGKVGIIFEGYKMKKSFIKRLPFRRGKGKFDANPKPLILNLKHLSVFSKGATVDMENIIKAGLVDSKDAKTFGVKILGDGEAVEKLIIALPISRSAAEKVIKKGGKILEDQNPNTKASRQTNS